VLPPIVITEPDKCIVLNSALLVKPQLPPNRELQGDVSAKDKITFLEGWLNESLEYGRTVYNQTNQLIDAVACDDPS
jgi:hypothetical protein